MNEYENNNLNLTNNSEQTMNEGKQLEGTSNMQSQEEQQINNNVVINSAQETENTNNIQKKSKKKLLIILIIVIILGIVLAIVLPPFLKSIKEKDNSSNNNTNEKIINEPNTNEKVNTDWKKLEFSIDGIKKQLPLTIDDLMKDLPDGWEYYRQSGNKKYETYKLTYHGSDKTLDGFILFWKNQETNMVYWISPAVDYVADGKRTGFETSGIKEGVTEKDVLKMLGNPSDGYGKLYNYSEDRQKNIWGYNYYVNNENDKDGYLSVSDLNSNDNSDKVTLIILIDNKNAPNYKD